jgi:hypothetical protein
MKSKKLLLPLMQDGATMRDMDAIAGMNMTSLTKSATLGAHATDPTIPAAAPSARGSRFMRALHLARRRQRRASAAASSRPTAWTSGSA